MNDFDTLWIAYAALGLGTIALLAAAYQLIKRGFLLWLLLAVVGVGAVNYGLLYGNTPLNDWVEGIDASAIGELSSKQIESLCRKAGY
ncbi:MAG: hypothetical protein RRB13_11355 [bacterium]|nr:hypothetical protein [bacterium]